MPPGLADPGLGLLGSWVDWDASLFQPAAVPAAVPGADSSDGFRLPFLTSMGSDLGLDSGVSGPGVGTLGSRGVGGGLASVGGGPTGLSDLGLGYGSIFRAPGFPLGSSSTGGVGDQASAEASGLRTDAKEFVPRPSAPPSASAPLPTPSVASASASGGLGSGAGLGFPGHSTFGFAAPPPPGVAGGIPGALPGGGPGNLGRWVNPPRTGTPGAPGWPRPGVSGVILPPGFAPPEGAPPPNPKPCNVCGKESQMECSLCVNNPPYKSTYYCSQAHQTEDWRLHFKVHEEPKR